MKKLAVFALLLGALGGDLSAQTPGGAYSSPAGGSGTSGSSSALNNGAWYLTTSACGAATNCTQINANGHAVTDVTTANTSPTISCPNNDCNFTSTDFLGRPNMAVGQAVWVTQGSGAGGILSSTTFACPNSTVLSFTAQSVTISNNCTANLTATGALYWGNKDGVALRATIGAQCTTYNLPAGVVIFTERGFGATRPACNTSGFAAATGAPAAALAGGIGVTTVIVMTPDFTWADCTGGAGSNTCFGSGLAEQDNFVVTGTGLTSASNANCANGNNKIIWSISAGGGLLRSVDLFGICPGASGMIGINLNSADVQLINGGAQDVGTIACEVTSIGVSGVNNDCHNLDVTGADGTVNGFLVTSGSSYVGTNDYPLSQISVAGSLISRGSHFITGKSNTLAAGYVESGGTWIGYGDFVGVDNFIGAGLPAIGVQVNGGGNLQHTNTTFKGSSAGIFNNNGTVFSTGGNKWVGVPSLNGGGGGVYTGVGVLTGTCQGTATSSATLALYNLGESSTLLCTGVPASPVTSGYTVQNVPLSGSVAQFYVIAGTGCKSGNTCVFTVMKTHAGTTSATTITCSMTAGASNCQDATHTDVPAIGDVYSIQFTTGATETLANVSATLLVW